MTWNRSPSTRDERFGRQAADTRLWQTAQNHRAALTVAGHAADAEDCRSLLDMLGLSAAEGEPLPRPTEPPTR
jgi:hypothetical protein